MSTSDRKYRLQRELDEQRCFLGGFFHAGKFNVTECFRELIRRNGGPLEHSAVLYWSAQIDEFLASNATPETIKAVSANGDDEVIDLADEPTRNIKRAARLASRKPE